MYTHTHTHSHTLEVTVKQEMILKSLEEGQPDLNSARADELADRSFLFSFNTG